MYILVCDDNESDRRRLCDKLSRCGEKHGIHFVVEEFPSGAGLLFRAEDICQQVDLIYLDVLMPGDNGFTVAGKLRSAGYIGDIVFICEKGDYVFSSFDYDALNYLIKGKTSDERFDNVIDRAIERMRERNKEVIVLSCAGDTRAIAIADIQYFEIIKRIVSVHYRGEVFEFYSTMSRLEEELAGSGFVRTHKSFLVNRKYISKLTARSLQLIDGTILPAGQRYVKNIKENPV